MIVLVAMAFIFTGLPGIYRKLITINNPENRGNNQQPQNAYLNVLSDQALAIMANVTGHTGNEIFIYLCLFNLKIKLNYA